MSAAVSSTTPHLEEELKNKVTDNNNVGGEPDQEQVPYSDGANSDVAEETEPEEDDESKLESDRELDLGPQVTLKEQLEKDKDDESLRKWKEQLLGKVDMSVVGLGESKDPEVKILSLTITSPDRPDLILPIPFTNDPKKSLFILKEGSKCRTKFTFTVSSNIVSGLKYTNLVWKTGVRVGSRKKMFGTFSPQQAPYTYELEEETIPCGMFARGTYAARTKFVDDDRKCYLDVNYYFEIQKNWATPQ
ncbi:rho GDP-dissociation inhibitor 1 [Cajanus cajan]|uniref:Rho GDP-dissociation inhibitor 1 n=1 Tax=Cajanus cajan TaxID=3821 RepID=A0A151U8N0_CAJCA|nr:rho GDP-dissociation inhibitor 1 [Cajanus cajan]KYP75660.1 Rho GDP-dissociation inhibitor 1 [Cajanus cajan]